MASKKPLCIVLIGLFAMCMWFSACSNSDIVVYANLNQEEYLYCTFISSDVNYNLVAFVYDSNDKEIEIITATQNGNGIIMQRNTQAGYLPMGKYKIVIKGDPGDYKFEDLSDKYEGFNDYVDAFKKLSDAPIEQGSNGEEDILVVDTKIIDSSKIFVTNFFTMLYSGQDISPYSKDLVLDINENISYNSIDEYTLYKTSSGYKAYFKIILTLNGKDYTSEIYLTFEKSGESWIITSITEPGVYMQNQDVSNQLATSAETMGGDPGKITEKDAENMLGNTPG